MKGLIYICYDDDYKNTCDTINDPIFFNSEETLVAYAQTLLLNDYEDRLNLEDEDDIKKLCAFMKDLLECSTEHYIKEIIYKYFEGEYINYTKDIIIFDIPDKIDDEKYNEIINQKIEMEKKYLLPKEEPKEELVKPKRKYVRKNKIST